MYKLKSDEELTDVKLGQFIQQHKYESTFKYAALQEAYMTDYPIFYQKEKPEWKPDNRIAVNFAKYIVDTMNGFFIGNPIKITSEDEAVAKYIELLDQYNDQDDNNAELSKICSIYGKGYEMYFVDDAGKIGITYLTPMEGFIIYDDSVLARPRFFVRMYMDSDNVLNGSISDETRVRYFKQRGKLEWEEQEKQHGFDGIPATEYVENAEEMGIFEPVLTMINAYNKAISEKSNDVDYFADAYMKILGALVDEKVLADIRTNRVINFDGEAANIVVEFLQKPDGDTTQENLINRLEKLIFQISMVANISDETFGTASGIALKYKLLAMSNLAKTKERKFTSGMNRRYRLIFSNPVSGMKKDDWVKIKYHFTQNLPANLLEESEIVKNIEGVVPKETQLTVLSIVDNAKETAQKMEDEAGQNSMIPPTLFGNAGGA